MEMWIAGKKIFQASKKETVRLMFNWILRVRRFSPDRTFSTDTARGRLFCFQGLFLVGKQKQLVYHMFL